MWGSLPPRFPVWLTAVSSFQTPAEFTLGGRGRKTRRGGLHVHHMYNLLMRSLAQLWIYSNTYLRLHDQSLEGEASRHSTFLLIPPIQSYTDSNTQPVYVGCRIHRLLSNVTGLPRQAVQMRWQRCPWFQFCFMPPPCLTHHCYTARMPLMEDKRVLGFIFLP